MSITKNIQPTESTVNNKDIAGIRRAIAEFLQRCGAQYGGFVLDEALNKKCFQEAIDRGIPMEGKFSVATFVAPAVAITANAYGHITDPANWMWICLFLAVITSIDDDLDGGQEMEHLCQFNDRFSKHQPQGNPALASLDELLWEAHCHYKNPIVSNLIITSVLDYVTSIMLDHETKDMQISTRPPHYAKYWRVLSGFPHLLVFMMFPSTLPICEYIQSMPELGLMTGYVNDILSFYKEEKKDESANYVSLLATSRGITKLDALRSIIDETVFAHHNILVSLKDHTEAYNAYLNFFHGYLRFHASPRYKLDEIMREKVTLEG